MLTLSARLIRLTPELQATARALGKEGAVAALMARQVRNDLQEHFAKKHAAEPNKLGAPRANFWLHIRSSTLTTLNGPRAEVVVNDRRFAQKVFGGRLTAQTARALTIPVHPQAYNRRARSIKGLVLLPSKTAGVAVLAKPGRGGFFEAYYILKKSVNQRPDPTALPPLDALRAAALRRAQGYLRQLVP